MLKGLNRPFFERKMLEGVRRAVAPFGPAVVSKSQGKLVVRPSGEGFDYARAVAAMRKVFGLAYVCDVRETAADMGVICGLAARLAGGGDPGMRTFKVEARRGDKGFHLNSMEICAAVGESILRNVGGVTVDLEKPSFVIHVEVRDGRAYVYRDREAGARGLPYATGGKAVSLLSGGIDSPVASWMMARRGVEIEAAYFHSYPYTTDRVKEKVASLVAALTEYTGEMRLHVVGFTKTQELIREVAKPTFVTLMMRGSMMRIASDIADRVGAKALVTGESMGQVASQTMEGLAATDRVVGKPVFRPLIGMDKNETIDLARAIGTYETSIIPYDDCCTLFSARHPELRPRPIEVDLIRSRLEGAGIGALEAEAAEGREEIMVRPGR